MSPETEEHRRIKEIVSDFLTMQYDSTLNEYPDSGNISDVMAVTNDGISVFVENVWTSSKNNFQRDLNILQRSTAEVKIFIVNPKILQDVSLRREFVKTRMTEKKKGFQVSGMIDGSKVLNEPDYVAKEFRKIVMKLVTEASKKKSEPRIIKRNNQSQLKHSKHILLTRSNYQGLDYWDKEMMIENLLLHGNDELETKSVMQHFETGYNNEVWSPLMEYKSLMDKYNYPTVPSPTRFDVASSIESGFFEEFERIPSNDRKRLQELKRQLIQEIKRIIFGVENGIPLKGQCDFCP
jgi:hypothetical protein